MQVSILITAYGWHNCKNLDADFFVVVVCPISCSGNLCVGVGIFATGEGRQHHLVSSSLVSKGTRIPINPQKIPRVCITLSIFVVYIYAVAMLFFFFISLFNSLLHHLPFQSSTLIYYFLFCGST